jgi:hypothetical protein
MAIDPKVKNLIRFILLRVGAVVAIFYVFLLVTGFNDFYRIVGAISLMILSYRIGISVWRRLILPPKDVLEYGKWAIVTGDI